MDIVIGHLLLAGVLISVLLLVTGLVWHWRSTGQWGIDYTIAGLNLFGFVRADIQQAMVGALRPRLLISLGLASLMLTPYLRVFISMLFFAFVEHNWKYTVFTAFVLSVLTYSLFGRS